MGGKRKTIGQRLAPARFILFICAFGAIGAAASVWSDWRHAVMIGFDAAALLFLGSSIPLLNHEPANIRRRAEENDANRGVLLLITGLVCIVILVTIGAELTQQRQSGAPIALIVVTLTIAWLFSNTIYALHYAHLYYSKLPRTGGDAGGISFPGQQEPDYSDFIYFAFTLGMTFQTSDTEISSRGVRRVAVAHCFAAFVFNIGVLAFTINVLGGS